MAACSATTSTSCSQVSEAPLPLRAKAGLALRIWALYPRVVVALRRERLPDLAARLGAPGDRRALPADRLSRAVDRSLRVGSHRPRCLVGALVLYRLLHEQGDAAELVIGSETWDMVAIVEYPSRAAFIEMVTSPEYQKIVHLREEALERSVLYATDPLRTAR